MDINFSMKPLAAVAGMTLLAANCLNAMPAEALTFHFESKEVPVRGSYTLDETIFDRLIASPLNTTLADAVTNFVITSGGTTDNSGVFRSSINYGFFFDDNEGITLNILTEEQASRYPDYPVFVPDFYTGWVLSFPTPEGGFGVCKVQACEGFASLGGQGGPGFPISQKPASVPEPTAMLGLSVIGGLLLLGKRSKSSLS